MNNWQKKSDFEINKAVSVLEGLVDIGVVENQVTVHKKTEDQDYYEFEYHKYDPCNNPSDACPIIFENMISIEFDVETNCDQPAAWCNASSLCGKEILHQNYKKPLRAAMIVYLEIKGVKP